MAKESCQLSFTQVSITFKAKLWEKSNSLEEVFVGVDSVGEREQVAPLRLRKYALDHLDILLA